MTETGIMLVLSVGYVALAMLIIFTAYFALAGVGKLIAFSISKHKEKKKP